MISQVHWPGLQTICRLSVKRILHFPPCPPPFAGFPRWGVACDLYMQLLAEPLPRLLYPELTNPSQNCFRKQIFVLKFDLFVNLFVMNFPFAWLSAPKVGGFQDFGLGYWLLFNCLFLAFWFFFSASFVWLIFFELKRFRVEIVVLRLGKNNWKNSLFQISFEGWKEFRIELFYV